MRKLLLSIWILFLFFPRQCAFANDVCVATDPASFGVCVDEITDPLSTTNTIHITSMIACSDVNKCEFEIGGLTRPIIIYGDGDTTGFRRTANYEYTILNISKADNLQIGRMHFDDVSDVCMGHQNITEIRADARCVTPIIVEDSDNVLFSNIKMSFPKFFGIQLIRTNNATIQNSFFHHVPVNAIHASSPADQRNQSYHVINNIFVYVKSSAVNVAGSGTVENPITIDSNVIAFSSYGGIYGSYPDAALYFTGSDVQHAKIVNNEIHSGQLLYNGETNGGIEIILGEGLSNIAIENNIIHDIVGCGICFIRFQDTADNISIQDNIIYNIATVEEPDKSGPLVVTEQYPGITPYAVEVFNNAGIVALDHPELGLHCFESVCVPSSAGVITAFPSPCFLDGSTCTSQIMWKTLNGGGAYMTANGTLFIGGNSGIANAPWINISPVTFVLYNGSDIILDEIIVESIEWY